MPTAAPPPPVIHSFAYLPRQQRSQKHVARHGFPENVTLQHVADWWRVSLGAFKNRLTTR
jgi:hypothetical protein